MQRCSYSQEHLRKVPHKDEEGRTSFKNPLEWVARRTGLLLRPLTECLCKGAEAVLHARERLEQQHCHAPPCSNAQGQTALLPQYSSSCTEPSSQSSMLVLLSRCQQTYRSGSQERTREDESATFSLALTTTQQQSTAGAGGGSGGG